MAAAAAAAAAAARLRQNESSVGGSLPRRCGGSRNADENPFPQTVRAPNVVIYRDQDTLEGLPKRSLRIVCISDTHKRHKEYERIIPDGDILVHAGDFAKRTSNEDVLNDLCRDFNAYLRRLPHEHKIVICGNHEIAANNWSSEKMAGLLSNATYLCDNAAEVHSLRFYGSPWTSSRNMAFSATGGELGIRWRSIPSDTDILVTHMPPANALDLASRRRRTNAGTCGQCYQTHPQHAHWGCPQLRQRLAKLRQQGALKAHIFGHVHDEAGWTTLAAVEALEQDHSAPSVDASVLEDDLLLVNAAMDMYETPVWFDVELREAPADTDCKGRRTKARRCAVM